MPGSAEQVSQHLFHSLLNPFLTANPFMRSKSPYARLFILSPVSYPKTERIPFLHPGPRLYRLFRNAPALIYKQYFTHPEHGSCKGSVRALSIFPFRQSPSGAAHEVLFPRMIPEKTNPPAEKKQVSFFRSPNDKYVFSDSFHPASKADSAAGDHLRGSARSSFLSIYSPLAHLSPYTDKRANV